MNIYLDIDGVIVNNKSNKAANYPDEFIEYLLSHYPDSTYWLTTHCQGDAERAVNDIKQYFEEKTVELLRKIKPTNWLESSNKTAAIDFTKPFLWFDDNCFYGEKQELVENGVFNNWIKVDLQSDPNVLLKYIHDFPLPFENIS